MNRLFSSVIAFLILLSCSFVTAAQVKVNAKELNDLAGNWEGNLEYLDYQDEKSKITLKLRAIVGVVNGKVSQQTVYIEPNGKEVKGGGSYALSTDGTRILEEKMMWTITKNTFDKRSKIRTIVYQTKWKDNDRNADLRETLLIGANEFSVTKEVRYENTSKFFVRNSHTYQRN